MSQHLHKLKYLIREGNKFARSFWVIMTYENSDFEYRNIYYFHLWTRYFFLFYFICLKSSKDSKLFSCLVGMKFFWLNACYKVFLSKNSLLSYRGQIFWANTKTDGFEVERTRFNPSISFIFPFSFCQHFCKILEKFYQFFKKGDMRKGI